MKRYGHERGTVHVLMRLAEEQYDMQRTIKEMAEAFGQLATVVTMQNTVADAMKDKIDGMQKHFDVDPRSTHAMVTSEDPDDD
jgi:hypothetical protein